MSLSCTSSMNISFRSLYFSLDTLQIFMLNLIFVPKKCHNYLDLQGPNWEKKLSSKINLLCQKQERECIYGEEGNLFTACNFVKTQLAQMID